MNTFSACVAFGPLAVYLLLLGVLNVSRRPHVINGTRETLSLALALSGLVTIGPMQLFMPQEAAVHFGVYVWLLLLAFYVLCLTLVLILSRPRLIVYNMSAERLKPLLDAAMRQLDPEAHWAGPAASLPLARVHLRVDVFPPLGNVTLVATSDNQSPSGWRRLERALRENLRQTAVPVQPYGFWLALAGLTMLSALAFWAADDPQTVAQGLQRLLRP